MSHFSLRRVAQLAGFAVFAATAGCASKPSSPAISDELPSVPDNRAATPLTSDGEPQRQKVVVDSVNDTVDRFDAIIRQREQAKRDAVDIRETREAAQATADAKAAKDDPSTIEKLAAKLRERQPIDPIPGEAETSKVASTTVEPTNIADADPEAAGPASGAITAQTAVEVKREAAPTISRGSGIDPWLSVQQKYAGRVADDPRDLSAQLDLQLARFLHDEPVPTMSDLSALPAEDRELLAAMCDALSNFRSVVRGNDNALSAVKAQPFIEMADRIRARSDLTLSGLTLCKRVNSFGVYDEIKPLIFTSNVENRVVVYCEVDGFISQLNADQMWETKLSLELKLFDDHGLQVWNVAPKPTVDLAARRRRDFCLSKIITLPPNLAGGHYLLKAQVRDLLGNRVNEETIQFAVKAGDAAATEAAIDKVKDLVKQ